MKSLLAIFFFFLAVVFYAVGIVGGIGYVGVYLGIVRPITTICEHIDADTLTASIAGEQVIFFFMRSALTAAVVCLGIFVGSIFGALGKSFSR